MASALVLLAPIPLWAFAAILTGGRDDGVATLAMALLALATLASPLLAFVLAFRVTLPQARAWVASVAAYAAAGLLYALLRPGGEIEPFAWKAIFWPVLLYWQDVCRLGLWNCPAG